MAEPRRFHFDSESRSVDVPAGRRRVPWYWIAISVAIHGAVVLFVLAGAARGGHSELAGTLEVTLVGPPSAGDPSGRSNDAADAKPEPSASAARPDETPVPPAPEALPRPTEATPAEIQPPRSPTAQPTQPQPPARPEPAAMPEVPATPPSPDGMARPVPLPAPADPQPSKIESAPLPPTPIPATVPPAPPPPREVPALTAEPAELSPTAKTETAPAWPNLPREAASVTPPPRPKAASAAKATPTAAPSAKTTEKAAAPKQGIKKAVEGQTASLGAPTGGDRLGRSESDDASGVLNVNLNPRFRQPPPPPRYPRPSVERDEEGVVLVRALVDPAGAPQRVIVFRSSGFPLLDDAALKAVQGWRFEPMVRDGRATAAWVQVPVRFRLN